MSTSAPPSPRRLQKLLLGLVAALAAFLLFLWLILPGILKAQAEAFVLNKTGHHLSLATPEFNPLSLRLRLTALTLTDPEQKPLAGFDELMIDLSGASLVQRALVFDEIQVAGLKLTLVEQADGRANWSPLIAALGRDPKAPEDTTDSPLPRIDIDKFSLQHATIDVADQRTGTSFSTRIDPLEISLSNVTTLSAEPGKLSLTASISENTRLTIDAAVGLAPLSLTGRIALDGLQLATLAPYLQSMLPGAPDGTLAASANYQISNGGDRLEAKIDDLALSLNNFGLPLSKTTGSRLASEVITIAGGSYDLGTRQGRLGALSIEQLSLKLPAISHVPSIGKITFKDIALDLADHQLAIGQLELAAGKLHPVRLADGKIDLLAAMQGLQASFPRTAPAAKSDPPSKPWRYAVQSVALTDWTLGLADQGVSPAAEIGMEAMNMTLQNLSERLDTAVPVRLSARFAQGGKISVEGKLTPGTMAANLKLALTDLALTPLQPYLSSRAKLTIKSGTLSTQGLITQGLKDSSSPSYTGGFELKNLRLDDSENKTAFLEWKRLGTNKLSATANQLTIGKLRLSGLDTQLFIAKDKSTNLSRLLKVEKPAAQGAQKDEDNEESAKPANPFVATIARLQLENAKVDFGDFSLVLPFATRIHSLNGSISGLSTQPGLPGQLEFDGEVDEYGLARAVGQIDLFNPTGFMDLRVIFRNVDMPRLSPYAATFAGRKIESGKLSLDLEYKITKRQMRGENKVIIDRLSLGERVESLSAKDLPLNLVIALLEDANGRIDLGVPVSGNLDDPQFSYGAIVWKAITNVLTKIVTSPFRALGALFGGDEKLDSISFEPGASVLIGPEREKLANLTKALTKRPNLMLTVHGLYTPEDRVALQDQQLRRTLLAMVDATPVAAEGDPGPVATGRPKIQGALEELYGKRVGKADLAALKEGFRQANPGQLEETTTGKMISRLSGLLREKKTLDETEVAKLKGGNFYSILYEHVRATEAIADQRLVSLGKDRGDYAIAQLKALGVASERLTVRAPEKGSRDDSGIPLGLELAPGKPAGG